MTLSIMDLHLRFFFFLVMPLTAWGYCEPPFEEVGDTCLYFAIMGEMIYQEASQFCQSMKGELAAITTPTQFKAMIDYINTEGLSERSYWLDGTDEANEGQWVSSTGSKVPMGTPFWAGYPDFQEPNGGQKENYMTLDYNEAYYLNDIPWNNAINAICEIQKQFSTISQNKSTQVDVCPTYYVYVGGKCLSFMDWLAEPWDQARQSCISNSGELVTIDDIELLRALYLYLHEKGLANENYWLGGSDAAQEGSWKWLDGSSVPMGTPFWGLGDRGQEPDQGTEENYLAMLGSHYHYFRDVSGDILFKPLCQYVPQ